MARNAKSLTLYLLSHKQLKAALSAGTRRHTYVGVLLFTVRRRIVSFPPLKKEIEKHGMAALEF
jgi:hypothetical protein